MSDEQLGIIELGESLADAEKPKDLRPGVYVGEIQDIQEKTSQAGNVYYAIKFVIANEDLPVDVQDENPDGIPLYWNRVLKPTDARSRYNLRTFMEAIGADTNVTTVDPNDFMGLRARLRVRPETYQGNTRTVIQSVEAAEKPTPKGRGRNPVLPVEEDEEDEAPAPRRGRPPGSAQQPKQGRGRR